MNLPNKITMARIYLSIALIVMLIFPFDLCGIYFKDFIVFGKITMNLKYLIAGGVFLVASITDTLDGYIARSRNLVTDFGKVMDAIADKVLVNGVLIALACDGTINIAIPIIVVTRDIFVDSIKMVVGSKGKAVGASILGKIKTIAMMTGITLTFFYNLPCELVNFDLANGLLYVATVLSVLSGIQYYLVNKEVFENR